MKEVFLRLKKVLYPNSQADYPEFASKRVEILGRMVKRRRGVIRKMREDISLPWDQVEGGTKFLQEGIHQRELWKEAILGEFCEPPQNTVARGRIYGTDKLDWIRQSSKKILD